MPHTKPLPFEKPGAGVDLTFIASFIVISRAVRCGQPLANLICWWNCTNYFQFREECNSRAPSLSSFIAFSARPMPTMNKLDEKVSTSKQVKMYHFVACQPGFPSLECSYQNGFYYKSCFLERRNLFGIYQSVILNRHFEF